MSAGRMDVLIRQRDFSPRPALPLRWKVDRMRWSDPGGPDTAVFSAANLGGLPAAALHPNSWLGAGVLDLIRCPVEVLADGSPCWWGWVEQIIFQVGALGLQVDLSQMTNRVAVRYRRLSPAGVAVADEQTDWADEPVSQERYGIKEALLRMQNATREAAAATRNAWLKEHSSIQERVLVNRRLNDRLLLKCRGWFSTLDWINYRPGVGMEEHPLPGGTSQAVGSGTSTGKLGQSFRVDANWSAGEIWLRIGKTGNPADSLRVQLCADSGGSPGMVLGTASNPAADLAAEVNWTGFSLPTPVELKIKEPYWIVVARSDKPSSTDYYRIATDESCGYPPGGVKLYNGSAWVLPMPQVDANFRVVGMESATGQIRRIPGALTPGTPGQFLSGVLVEGEPDSLLPVWRDGSRTAGVELRSLLSMISLCRARVTPERWLIVEPRPEPSAACRVGTDGIIQSLDGSPLPLGRIQAGMWVAFSPVFRSQPVWLPGMLWTERSGIIPVLP